MINKVTSNPAIEAALGKLAATPQGRKVVAQSMTQPLRDRLDYMGMGRKAFLVEELPKGALPYYDKDVDVRALIVAENGQTILSVQNVERILVPLFEIATIPEVSMTELAMRRYNVLQRMQDKALIAIMEVEDTLIFNVLEEASKAEANCNPPVQYGADMSFTHYLAQAASLIERRDLRISRIFMNPKNVGKIRQLTNVAIDFVTQRELLQVGYIANLWGAAVLVSRRVPEDKVYLTAEAEFVGRIPVSIPVTVMPADNPRERKIGFSVFEFLGVTCHNCYAVSQVYDIN